MIYEVKDIKYIKNYKLRYYIIKIRVARFVKKNLKKYFMIIK